MCHMWKTAVQAVKLQSSNTQPSSVYTLHIQRTIAFADFPSISKTKKQKSKSGVTSSTEVLSSVAVHRPRKPVYSDIKELDLASLNSPSQPSVSLILRFFCQIAFSVAECTATKKMHISYGLSSESKQLGAGFRDYVGRQIWHPCPLNQPPVTLWGLASVLTV